MAKTHLPKKECCLDRPRCKRCPIRALAEGTLPPRYTVKRRRLVRLDLDGGEQPAGAKAEAASGSSGASASGDRKGKRGKKKAELGKAGRAGKTAGRPGDKRGHPGNKSKPKRDGAAA